MPSQTGVGCFQRWSEVATKTPKRPEIPHKLAHKVPNLCAPFLGLCARWAPRWDDGAGQVDVVEEDRSSYPGFAGGGRSAAWEGDAAATESRLAGWPLAHVSRDLTQVPVTVQLSLMPCPGTALVRSATGCEGMGAAGRLGRVRTGC